MPPLLLERFPQLDLPWQSIGHWPTPLRSVAEGLWIKDEGQCAPQYGGNKVRKLEFLLAEARQRGLGDVVTVGVAGSHHVFATALYARRMGLRPHALLFPQPDQPHAREMGRLNDSLLESWQPAQHIDTTIAAARTWSAIQLVGRKRPYWIPAGGSNALGAIGWVSAGLEIAESVANHEIPPPRRVVVPLGSGGTAAGILVGLRLGGLDSEVLAVRVAPRPISRWWVLRQARGAIRRLGLRATRRLDLSGLSVSDDWLAGGYGHTNAKVLAARERGEQLGIPVETTYVAKALGACLELQHRGPTLFCATLNSVPLDGLLADAMSEVPARMEPLFRR